eukprot:TRINITY_DN8451_c0_g1_i1.p1 TRINITY_DN8451_c0_g1~~TRINITY_DN8451_c0_g1_i1.p1  ORF type:complete len:329 (+),score=34.19 TRINITY_DN8451_c0_g1_i1:83-988(+)
MADPTPTLVPDTTAVEYLTGVPGSDESHAGLSRFQELVAGVLCAVVFLTILVQVLYRSKKRQSTLRRVTQKAELSVFSDQKNRAAEQRNEIAAESLAIFAANRTPYVPYTGRKVPGIVDLSREAEVEENRHSRQKDLLDFREYARYVAVAIRAEIHSLGEEGVITRLPGELDTHTLRDLLTHALEGAALPKQDRSTDPEGEISMSAGEAVQWVCDRYEEWRWGLRPGHAYVAVLEVKRFRLLADSIIRHLQNLSPRCALCNEFPKTVIFKPCLHQCCCSKCAVKRKVCPVCNEAITEKDAG